jgi:hypothetical protein
MLESGRRLWGVSVKSDEHAELRPFSPGEIDGLPMPDGYRASIRATHTS